MPDTKETIIAQRALGWWGVEGGGGGRPWSVTARDRPTGWLLPQVHAYPRVCLLPPLVAQDGAWQRDVALQQQVEQRALRVSTARVAAAHVHRCRLLFRRDGLPRRIRVHRDAAALALRCLLRDEWRAHVRAIRGRQNSRGDATQAIKGDTRLSDPPECLQAANGVGEGGSFEGEDGAGDGGGARKHLRTDASNCKLVSCAAAAAASNASDGAKARTKVPTCASISPNMTCAPRVGVVGRNVRHPCETVCDAERTWADARVGADRGGGTRW